MLRITTRILKNPLINSRQRTSSSYSSSLPRTKWKHSSSHQINCRDSVHYNPKISFSSIATRNNELISKEDGAIGRVIDFDVASRIEGEESQIVIVDIEPGQILRAESGSMIYMTEGIEMSTSIGSASNAFTKFLVGQNLFYSDFTYQGTSAKGQVALGTEFPSKILRYSISSHNNIIAQKGALLCYSHTIEIEREFTKNLSTGFFGGEGFILLKLSGEGDAFLKAGGHIIKRELEPNEELRISSGSLVAFTEGVEYDVAMMPGVKNVLFGGEGLFVTTLKGPGTVWLQGNPQDKFIAEIARRIPSRSGIPLGIPIPGSSGGTSAEEGEAESAANEDATPQELESAEAAIEADRNSTVASSGLDTSNNIDSSDPDSPSSLFGDAAPSSSDTSSTQDSDFYSTSSQDNSSFSSDDSFDTEIKDHDFFDSQEDQTTFNTENDSSNDLTDGEEGKGFLSSLWDFFTDDD